MATRGDFVQDYEEKENLLNRAYLAAVAIDDRKNLLEIAHSLAELYVDELVNVEEGRKWLDRLDAHLLDVHDATYAADAQAFRRKLEQRDSSSGA